MIKKSWYNELTVDWSGVEVPDLSPDVFAAWKLVRRTRCFPLHGNDGKAVYEGTDTSAVDTGLLGGIDYYYGLYAVDADGHLHTVTEWLGKDFPVGRFNTPTTYGYEEKLFNDYLPNLYHLKDSQFADSPMVAFLKIPAFILEYLHTIMDRMRVAMDADEINYEHLAALGKLVGWVPNYEVPILRQREEIKMAVHTYRRKGTVSGIESIIESISGWDVKIQEAWRNILLANTSQPGTPDTLDNYQMQLVDEPGDQLHYCWDVTDESWVAPDVLIIYLKAVSDLQKFFIIKNKLERVLKEYVPAGMRIKLVISTLDREGKNDSWKVEEVPKEFDFFDYMFYTPDTANWHGEPMSPIYPDSSRLWITNSRLWLTADTGVM